MVGFSLKIPTYQHVAPFHARRGNALENLYGGNLIVGSNPTSSASFRREKAPQTEICGASFLGKSSNVDQMVWVTSTFLALYPLMVGNPILRPIPVLGLPRISLTSIPLPQSLFRTAQRCHCCPRATMCTTVHSSQFLRL